MRFDFESILDSSMSVCVCPSEHHLAYILHICAVCAVRPCANMCVAILSHFLSLSFSISIKSSIKYYKYI